VLARERIAHIVEIAGARARHDERRYRVEQLGRQTPDGTHRRKIFLAMRGDNVVVFLGVPAFLHSYIDPPGLKLT
jgi:hypothetical protein